MTSWIHFFTSTGFLRTMGGDATVGHPRSSRESLWSCCYSVYISCSKNQISSTHTCSASNFTSLEPLTIYHGGATKKPLLIPWFVCHLLLCMVGIAAIDVGCVDKLQSPHLSCWAISNARLKWNTVSSTECSSNMIFASFSDVVTEKIM